MEVLESLTNILIDIVRNIKFDDGKRAFIREHIKNVETDGFPKLRLPVGQDWFNVIKPLTDSDLRGKVVVLDFFTYCCINCLHLLPHLKRLEEKFPVANGLVVIGVHSAKFENEKKSSNIALALKKLDVSHPVINDANSNMWNRMKVSCWPTLIIIGPSGHPLFTLTGEQRKDELFLFVEAAIEFYAGEISTHPLPICGSQNVTSGVLNFPGKIARCGNVFAVSDSGNHRVLVVDDTGCIQYRIGSGEKGFRDGAFEHARFNSPQGLAFYTEFQIFVADTENHAIRLIDLVKFEVITVVGTGSQGTSTTGGKIGIKQEISSPWDVCFVPSDHVVISCNNVGLLPPDSVRAPGQPCGTHASPFSPNEAGASSQSLGLPAVPPPPPLPPTFAPTEHARAGGISANSLQVKQNVPRRRDEEEEDDDDDDDDEDDDEDDEDIKNNVLLIAMSGIHQIWAYFLEDTIWWKGKKYGKNVCVAIAGNGREENRNNTYPMLAAFAQPSGLTYSESQRCVFIADSESSSIRKLSLEDGAVSHVVGGDRNPVNLFKFGDVDGRGYDAKLQHPLGVTFNEKEGKLYVCDTYNNKLKRIDVNTMHCGRVNDENELFNEPGGCVFDEAEDILYVADTNNHRVVTYSVQDGVINDWVIREKEEDIPEMKFDEEWEMDTEFSESGGLITLIIHLGPDDIHGKWRLDLTNANIESRDTEGVVSSESQELELVVYPNGLNNTDIIRGKLSSAERTVGMTLASNCGRPLIQLP